MYKLRIIIRNLLKRKLSTSFTLIGFTIAFCCCILVYLFVADETVFDKYNSNFESVYRLNIRAKDNSFISCNFPGVYYDNLKSVSGGKEFSRFYTARGEVNITIDQQPFLETGFLFSDPALLNILDFEFLIGNPNDALSNPLNVIITKSASEKYFGNENPLGKIIKYDNHDFTVTAVIKDIPKQSHFSLNFLASASSYNIINEGRLTQWHISSFNFYLLLSDSANKSEISNQLSELYCEGHGINSKKREFDIYLEPIGDIHLKSVLTRWDNAIKGDIKIVYGLIVIALLILSIAIVNYVNFLTAEFRRKVKESGIRRINGASRRIMFFEQAFESLLLLLIAITLSTVLSNYLLPIVNGLTDKSLIIGFSIIYPLVALLIFSTLVSLVYPVIFYNSFNPSDAVKNQISLVNNKGQQKQYWVRGSLVTFQLTIATLLIISAIVINRQLQLMVEAKTGFDKENVLTVVNPYSMDMNKRYELFKSELLNLAMVKSVGVAQNNPGESINNYSPIRLPDNTKNESTVIGQITVDHDFLSAIGARFIEGRNFDENISADKKSAIVINQTAVNTYNLDNPVGSKLGKLNNAYTPNGELEIIGVIEDMQYFTLKEEAKPVMYYIRDWGKHNITVRLTEGNYTTTLDQMKSIWNEIAPDYPFSFQFMDDRITSNYKSEINAAKVVSILSVVAIILSILGIFATVVFTMQRRIKEIGIRKINGATIAEIFSMLNADFVKWVGISLVFACPISYLAMNKWLENFAYKTELSWWVFALAGLLVLCIALLTVSWQSWRAATRNPVEALRYE
jgi:putative ABC transport system permease protein